MNLSKAIKNIADSVNKDDCSGMAAEMAFNFILSMFPFLIFVASIFGLFGSQDIIDRILHFLKNIAPSGVLILIEQTLKEISRPTSGGLLTGSFMTGLLFGSNAIRTVMKVLNKAYGVPETRSFIKTRIISILVIFIFLLVMIFATNFVVMGNIILNFLSRYFEFPQKLVELILFARWPVSFMLLSMIGLIIYYFMPNIKANMQIKLFSAVPGTIFFSFFWLIFSRLFGLYVENISMFNRVYGTVGAGIALLLWLYYTSLVILIGGEINSEVYKQSRTRDN